MLTITVLGEELWDEEEEEFSAQGDVVLHLEHSLVSMSKWESKYGKRFLGEYEKTVEETLGYIEAMLLTTDFPPEVLQKLSEKNLHDINEYINSPQSATTFRKESGRQSRATEEISSELIYYWMVSYNVPFECETWHLNRLFALLRICNIKNADPKKRSRREIAEERAQLNAKRREQLQTRG